jgi:hypothetical protein
MSTNHELTKLRVTKIDAARRQLETAITLWFHEADPVSIHTLACASFQLLYDINSQVGGSPMFPDRMAAIEKTEARKKYLYKFLRKAQNFFKHADNDASQTFAFNTDQTEIFIFEACQKYYEIAHEDLPLMKLFHFYLRLHNPDIFGQSDPQKNILDKPGIQKLKSYGKPEFLLKVLPGFFQFGAA